MTLKLAIQKPEVLSRTAKTTAVVTKLKVIWNDKNIAMGSKIRLTRSLVMSILLYACKKWILTAEFERNIQAMEVRCLSNLVQRSHNQ